MAFKDKAQQKEYQRKYYQKRISDGICIHCKNKSVSKWFCQEHLDKSNEKSRQYTKNIKKIVIEHYGGECTCCGEKEIIFLTIDHKNNNGAEHRLSKGRKDWGGRMLYQEIIRKNFPDEYQILCFNCNNGKSLNGGICPHKSLTL